MNTATGSGRSGGGGSGAVGGGGRSWPSSTSVSGSGKRIQKEMAELHLSPPSDCSAGPISDNLYHWIATIIGPQGTPYEGGIFFLNISFPNEYPFKPPQPEDYFEVKLKWSECSLPSSSVLIGLAVWLLAVRIKNVSFITRIYHCNVDSSGKVNLGIIKDGWSPALTISKVLVALRSMFSNPEPYDPIAPGSVAHLYLVDKAKHDEIAADWTLRFAR